MDVMARADRLDALVAELRRVRIERGIRQREVAAAVGVAGQQVVANWERRRSRPCDESLHAWAVYLDVAVPVGVHGWLGPACGTVNGYNRHRRRWQEPCDPCAAARHAYDRGRP